MRAVLPSEPISLSFYVCSMLDAASIRAHVTWARLALPMWLAGADTIEAINFLRMWNERSIDLSSSQSSERPHTTCTWIHLSTIQSLWEICLLAQACHTCLQQKFCFLYIEQRVNVRGKAGE